MFRHLPPVATPLEVGDLAAALTSGQSAESSFRQALQNYFDGGLHLPLASGRMALHLLLQVLKKSAASGRRDIILPAYTCPALLAVIINLDLKPRLVDVQPETMAMDQEALLQTLSEQSLAVIWVHPFGLPQEFGWLHPEAQRVGALLIEDAAQSMGARLAGGLAGRQADFAVFSLGPGKALSTAGGGILTVNNGDYRERLEEDWHNLAPAGSLTALFRLAAVGAAFRPSGWWLAHKVGAQRAGNSERGLNYRRQRLSLVQAATAHRLLPKLDEFNRRRREKALAIRAELQTVSFAHFFQEAPRSLATYLRLPLLLDSPHRREELVENLNRAGIGAGRMYGQPLSFRLGLPPGSFPGAESVARRLLTLPTHHHITKADIARIGRIFRK